MFDASRAASFGEEDEAKVVVVVGLGVAGLELSKSFGTVLNVWFLFCFKCHIWRSRRKSRLSDWKGLIE